MSFVRLPFPPFLVLICRTVYYLVGCLPQFSLISSSVFLDLSFCLSPHIPPFWILFHPSFCLFAFLNLSFSLSSLIWPDFLALPDSVVFSLIPIPFFMTSFSSPIPQYLPFSIISLYFLFILHKPHGEREFESHCPCLPHCLLLILQYDRSWHMYWVLTLSLSLPSSASDVSWHMYWHSSLTLNYIFPWGTTLNPVVSLPPSPPLPFFPPSLWPSESLLFSSLFHLCLCMPPPAVISPCILI